MPQHQYPLHGRNCGRRNLAPDPAPHSPKRRGRRPPFGRWIEPVEQRLLLATIRGVLYNDLDRDGSRDGDEDVNNLSSFAFVDADRDGVFDSTEPNARGVFPTGDYAITGVPVGTHELRLSHSNSYRQTQPAGGASYTVTVETDDQVISGFDFGLENMNSGTISGVVLHDRDGDGERDPEDTPLVGWTVFRDGNGNGVMNSNDPRTTTGPDGRYRFDWVDHGFRQQITLLAPDGWRASPSAPPVIHGRFPSAYVTASAGLTSTLDFFSVPAPHAEHLDPTFGVGGAITPLFPQAHMGFTDQIFDVHDAPGEDGGFFVLGSEGLFKLRDDGSPDHSFGLRGRVALTETWDRVAVDSLGRPVIANASGFPHLRRFTPDGTLDTTFGTNGDWTFDTITQATERMVVADLLIKPGDVPVLAGTHKGKVVVAQMNADATGADTAFGVGGIARFGNVALAAAAAPAAIALDPDGSLVVTAKEGPHAAVYRLTPAGALDNAFAGDGQLVLDSTFPVNDVASVTAVHVQPDGEVLLSAIRGQPAFHVLRLTAGGALDTTFGGGDGVATVPFPRGTAHAPAVASRLARDADGRIVVAGTADVTMRDRSELAVARLLPDGTLDETYGDAGRLRAPIGWLEESLTSAYLDANGDVVAAVRPPTTSRHHTLLRLRPRPTPLNLAGVVFNDLDEDGVREDGEPGVGGVAVFIDRDADGQHDPADEPAAVTNARGGYAFTAPAGAPQRVAIVRPDGWSLVAPAAGAHTLTVPAGDNARAVNFALGDVTPPRVLDVDLRPPTKGSEVPVWAVRFDEPIAFPSLNTSAFSLRTPGGNVTLQPQDIRWEPDTDSALVRTPSHIYAGALDFFVQAIGELRPKDLSGNGLTSGTIEYNVLYARSRYTTPMTIRRSAAGDVVELYTGETPTPIRARAADLEEIVLIPENRDLHVELVSGSPFPAGVPVWLDAGGSNGGALRIDGAFGAADHVAFSGTAVTIDGVRAETRRFTQRLFNGRGGRDVLSVSGTSVAMVPGDRDFDSVEITDGATLTLQAHPGGLHAPLVTRGLLIGDDAALQLNRDDLIVHTTPGTRDALLAATIAHVRRGRLGDGGISASPGQPHTRLAATLNPGLATFNGQAVDENSILVTSTYNGDANLDGRVNADDYFRIDQGFLAQPQNPLYTQGDFNYDGRVNADDYFLIDQAFLGQGAPLSGDVSAASTAAAAAATPPMPEEPREKVVRKRAVRPLFSDAPVIATRASRRTSAARSR